MEPVPETIKVKSLYKKVNISFQCHPYDKTRIMSRIKKSIDMRKKDKQEDRDAGYVTDSKSDFELFFQERNYDVSDSESELASDY